MSAVQHAQHCGTLRRIATVLHNEQAHLDVVRWLGLGIGLGLGLGLGLKLGLGLWLGLGVAG